MITGQIPGYPHTQILDLPVEADHPDKIILPERTLTPSDSLWYSAAIGTCNDEMAGKLEVAGIEPVPVGDGSGTNDAIEEQQRRSKLWAPKTLAVAGNTVSDFCLYLALSRLRERVLWVFPAITEAALSGICLKHGDSFAGHFAHSLRVATEYVQQHSPGVDIVSSTLDENQMDAVKAQIGVEAGAPLYAAILRDAGEAIPDYPVRFLERSNAGNLRVHQVPDTRVC